MNLVGTILAYAGFLVFLVGGLSILRPLTFLNIWSRFQGVMLLVVGVLLFLIGVKLPAREQRVETPTTHLDEFVPTYQFSEFHSIRVKASRERVYAAMREVTADEITEGGDTENAENAEKEKTSVGDPRAGGAHHKRPVWGYQFLGRFGEP